MNPTQAIRRLGATLALVVLGAACSEGGTSGPPVPSALAASGTFTPGGIVGSTVSPAVVVTDAKGNPIGGVAVTFEVSSGGGSVTASSVSTDASGRAAASWTLGTAVGTNTLVARSGALAAVTFNAASTADVPASLTAVSGNLTSAPVGAAVATAPGVLVRDRFSNPVSSAQVTFTPGNASGTVTGGVATSGADGIARPGTWTLAGTVGNQTLAVSSGTLNSVLTIAATPGAPSFMSVAAGGSQTSAVGAAIGTRPAVRVADSFGNVIANVTVIFAPATGSGSVAGGTQSTDASGIATVGNWTLGPTVGPQTLNATAGTVSSSVTVTAIAGPAASIVKTAGDNQTAQPLSPVAIQPRVRVTDGFGNVAIGRTVNFQVTTGGGSVQSTAATTDANGLATSGVWTLGATQGANVLTATVSGVTPITFSATASATAPVTFIFTRFAGNGTACPVSSTGCSFTVQLQNAAGQPVSGQQVRWTTSGSGAELVMNTNQFGRATATNLAQATSPTAVVTQTATLVATGEQLAFTYSTVPTGNYNITVRFIGTPTPSQQVILTQAAQKWEQVITRDLVPVASGNVGAGACGIAHPAFNETVDDLLIYIQVVPIDGPGQVLGSAGFCGLRDAADLGDIDMPWLGVMRLDSSDVALMETQGRLLAVVQHEIGHILGIGTLWSRLSLTQGTCAVDPYFSGPRAIPGFQLAGGTLTNGVPIENSGGAGTICAHWRESTLTNELMTGFNNSGANPLSAITIGSLMDLGYQVNFGAAEAFTLQGSIAGLRLGPAIGDLHIKEEPYTPPAPGVLRPGRR